MRIDRKLNLIFPMAREDGSVLYAFSAPMRKETFETYALVIAKTFERIHAENIVNRSGPRVSAMILKEVAKSTTRINTTIQKDGPTDWWDGDDGVEKGLLGEWRRLTTILAPNGAGGWDTVMYDIALRRDLMSEEEQSEVEGAIAFFMVVSAMHRKTMRIPLLAQSGAMWGWSITYSDITEFRNSLTTSTKEEDSGTKETLEEKQDPSTPRPPSSIPI